MLKSFEHQDCLPRYLHALRRGRIDVARLIALSHPDIMTRKEFRPNALQRLG